MLYGTVLRAPVEGSVPDKIDEAKAKAIAGVVRDRALALRRRRARRHAVGGVRRAPRSHAVRDLDAGPARPGASTATRASSGSPPTPRTRRACPPSGAGSAIRAAQMPKAASTMEAEYRCDYAYHAQMEPLNAIASVSPAGDAVEIWAGTQSQTTATEAPAKILGIPKDKVKLHDMLMGGGFGRRGNRDVDFIIDAVLMSKEAGRPVKVMWTREDDVANGRFRPISAHALKAGFDAVRQARPPGITASPSTASAPTWTRCATRRRAARTSSPCSAPTCSGYDVPHQLVEQLYRDTGVRTNPLRGISFIANRFATEVVHRRDRAQARQRSGRLPSRAPEGHPARHQGGRAGGADGGVGQETRRPRARLRLSRLFRLAGCRHRRGLGQPRAAARSRCITSGAPSTAAWRCSPTT